MDRETVALVQQINQLLLARFRDRQFQGNRLVRSIDGHDDTFFRRLPGEGQLLGLD
jgi:hypothetical protein